jgi:hypothetical protein
MVKHTHMQRLATEHHAHISRRYGKEDVNDHKLTSKILNTCRCECRKAAVDGTVIETYD